MSDQEKDPVVHSSLSKPLFISSALLVLSMVWGLYDEVYGIRPWKGYQARFVKLYSRYLKTAAGGRGGRRDSRSRRRPTTSSWIADMQAAEKAAMPAASAIDKKINQELVPKILALNDPFQEVRSHIGALTYQIEVIAQREQQGFAAQRDRGTAASRSTMSRCPARPEAQHGFQGHERAAAGVEGRKGEAAAAARGHHEAGHGTAGASATSTCPTASPTPAPGPSRQCRTRSISSISGSGRFT